MTGIVFWYEDDTHSGRYIGHIDNPANEHAPLVEKKCVQAGPLVKWMEKWAIDRGVTLSVTVHLRGVK